MSRPSTRHAAPTLRAHLTVDSLEDRFCPAILNSPTPVSQQPTATSAWYREIALSGVTGTGPHPADQQDLIVINPAGFGAVRITHHVGTFQNQGGAWVSVGSYLAQVQDTTVSVLGTVKFVIRGGDGRDIVIDNTNHPDEVHGGPGPDTIYTGGGADRVWSNGGGGEVDAGAGNDEVYGGEISATAPHQPPETLSGGPGADLVVGGGGEDTIIGGADSQVDRLIGGNDAVGDTFYVEWTPIRFFGDVSVQLDETPSFSSGIDTAVRIYDV